MTVDQFFAYLNTTYANNAAVRGQLAGAAYRVKQYQADGFPIAAARAQGKFNPRHAALLSSLGELAAFDVLT